MRTVKRHRGPASRHRFSEELVPKFLKELGRLAVGRRLLGDCLEQAGQPKFRHFHIRRYPDAVEMLASNGQESTRVGAFGVLRDHAIPFVRLG